jgi:hypothetical protein
LLSKVKPVLGCYYTLASLYKAEHDVNKISDHSNSNQVTLLNVTIFDPSNSNLTYSDYENDHGTDPQHIPRRRKVNPLLKVVEKFLLKMNN